MKLTGLNKLRKRLLQESTASPPKSSPPPLRVGEIPKAITKVLAGAKEPMHVAAIHRAVEHQFGQAVNYRSVKSCLSDGARQAKPRFIRIAYGEYQFAPAA